MNRYIKILAGVCLLLSVVASCNRWDEEAGNNAKGGISFTGSIVPAISRATDAGFEDEDDISVFAFKEHAAFSSEGYAMNVRYMYAEGQFHAEGPAITYPSGGGELSFWAIHPYCKEAASSFKFDVKEDQRRVLNYTYSDLMTASTGMTTSIVPSLTFDHRLSCVHVNVVFEEGAVGTTRLDFCHVQKTASVDMVALTFKGIGEPVNTLRATPNGERSYKVILPPQTIAAGTEFVTVATETGKTYVWKVPEEIVLTSGSRYTYNLHVSVAGVVTCTAEINPWGEPGDIEAIIPPALVDSLEKYMPIYRGKTPPNVEGIYLVRPNEAVYCQDNGFVPGTLAASNIIHFYNQNEETLSLEYKSRNFRNTSSAHGTGSFISGSGNNFTIYFDTEGEMYGIYAKTADVYSGTIDEKGIVNLHHGFVMVEKGDDPEHHIMSEGVFRLFRDGDGLATPVLWDYDPSVIKGKELEINPSALIGEWRAVWYTGNVEYAENQDLNYSWDREKYESFSLKINEDGTGSGFYWKDSYSWTLKQDSLTILYGDTLQASWNVIKKVTPSGMLVEVKMPGTDSEDRYYMYTSWITYEKVNTPSVRSTSPSRSSMPSPWEESLMLGRSPYESKRSISYSKQQKRLVKPELSPVIPFQRK